MMSLFSSKPSQAECSLKDQGAAVARSAGKALSGSVAHLSTLLELFLVEAREWSGRVARKTALLVAGVVIGLFGYGALVVLAGMALSGILGWEYSLVILGVFHLAVGGGLVISAVNRKTGALAPDTVQEIKNDIQCIRILLQEESKNC